MIILNGVGWRCELSRIHMWLTHYAMDRVKTNLCPLLSDLKIASKAKLGSIDNYFWGYASMQTNYGRQISIMFSSPTASNVTILDFNFVFALKPNKGKSKSRIRIYFSSLRNACTVSQLQNIIVVLVCPNLLNVFLCLHGATNKI